INPQRTQRIQIQFLKIFRRRFQNNLKLMMPLYPIGIFAITPVCWPPTRLYKSSAPRLWTNGTQKACRMECASANLHINRLQQYTPLFTPEVLQGTNHVLKSHCVLYVLHISRYLVKISFETK